MSSLCAIDDFFSCGRKEVKYTDNTAFNFPYLAEHQAKTVAWSQINRFINNPRYMSCQDARRYVRKCNYIFFKEKRKAIWPSEQSIKNVFDLNGVRFRLKPSCHLKQVWSPPAKIKSFWQVLLDHWHESFLPLEYYATLIFVLSPYYDKEFRVYLAWILHCYDRCALTVN